MPEGDSLRRAARGVQALVGERVRVETPHPHAASTRIAERLDGRTLVAVEAVGKNLLLRFEGGLVLRSHLRMRGRWRLQPIGTRTSGLPWLVLRGSEAEAVLWNGPVLELRADALRRLGPDILDEPLDADGIVARLLAEDGGREIGDALLDQRLVAGIGNLWRAEALWSARVSPWRPLRDLSEVELRTVVGEAHRLMRTALHGGRPARRAYRRSGRPCARCGTRLRSRGQGDDNRTAYWCPTCQPDRGAGPPRA